MTLPLMLGDRLILMVLYPRPLIIFPIFASNLASLNSCRGDLFWGSSEGLFWSIQDICIAYSGGSFEGLILSIQDVWMAYARIGVAKRQFKLHFSNNCNFQLDELKMESKTIIVILEPPSLSLHYRTQFALIQICQDCSTLPLISFTSKYFRYICRSRNEHFSISLFNLHAFVKQQGERDELYPF